MALVSIRTETKGEVLSTMAIPQMMALAAISTGVMSIASTLWLEILRDGRRRRLARSVASILRDQDFYRSGETHFKRVA
jgi:hypothetical protein